jgi:DNA-binding beta-propeller fold protein YncE
MAYISTKVRLLGYKSAKTCFLAAIIHFCLALSLHAQLNQNCTISVLNRTVTANADGSWVLPNVPANFGLVRARATCVQNGVTTFGQSDLFSLGANQTLNLPHIQLGISTPIPNSMSVLASSTTLSNPGDAAQLTVTGTYADGSTQDLTAGVKGTLYNISNPGIATVSADGLVTAVSSGTAVIQAVNEGTAGVISIQVVLAGASHGGIPDSWAIEHGLDPNDPAMPFEDPDHDGLTNLQEFQNGTDPHNPDTDGDGLTDGQEVLLYHSSPVLFSTDGTGISDGIEVQTGTLGGTLAQKLAAALQSLEVKPASFVLNVNTIQDLASQQLTVLGHLIDGKTTLDLTSTQKGTNYSSSDLTICNFGAPDGNVFAGSNGACTITVSNNGFTAQAQGIVRTFAPTSLAFIPVPGFANSVDVNGDFAFVAAGGAGLQVINIADRTQPVIAAALPLPGNANGVKLLGNFAYVASGSSGLNVIDVSNPLAPLKVGSLSTGANALNLAVRGTSLYVANGSNLLIADVTNPVAPTTVSVLPLNGTIQGVDVDAQRGLAVVAAGPSGIYVVDISKPAAPVVRGTALTGDARNVILGGNVAFIADFLNSTTSVDITSPSAPIVLSHILDPNLGGFLQDIVLSGTFALAADVKFVNGIPITDISDPLTLRARAILNFPQRDDNGMGIAADGTFVYLTTEHSSLGKFGSFGDSRLYIGQYLALVDNRGIPPTAAITSPTPGSTVIEGSVLPITVDAADDVAVAAVTFSANGTPAFTSTAKPYQFNFTVPVGSPTLTLDASAVDLGGNIGKATTVTVNVIPDPLTMVTGNIVDQNNNPVGGASINCLGFTAVSGLDGSFSLSGVPTIKGNIFCTARFVTAGGAVLSGTSASVPPVRGSVTNIGTIVVRAGGRLVVAQRDAGTIQVLKTAPLSLESTVNIGSDVIDVAVSPDGTTAAVSSFSAARVTFVDLTSQPPAIVGAVSVPLAAEAVAFTPDGKFVVVTDGGGSTSVVSINVATKTIASTLSLPVAAEGVGITVNNQVLIVAFDQNQIRILNISSAGILSDAGAVSPGVNPINVAASPNGQIALTANFGSANLGILRLSGGSFISAGSVLNGFSEPQSVSFLANGTAAFTLSCAGQIARANIDAAGVITDSGVRLSTGFVPCYFGVHQIVALPNSLQVAVHTDTGVTIIDATTNTVSSSVALPGNDSSAGGIAVVP